MKNIIFLLFIFLTKDLLSQRMISGVVKSNGKGVANIIVSSGFQFTKTDKRGKYKLHVNEGNRFVQITSPAGYKVKHENSVPKFYHELIDSIGRYDFIIEKNFKDETNHMLVVQTDVQVANLEELGLYRDIIIPDLKETINSFNNNDIIGFDLGDMVGDDPKLFPSYLESMKVLNIPFFRVIGNHDMAYWGRTFETSIHHFNKYFGPTRYSFNKGKIHYIVLNNNFYVGRDYFYIGYLDEETFKWLEKDLSFVPKGSTIFLMVHIPTQLNTIQEPFSYNYEIMGGSIINAKSLYKILEDYRVHILSGHTHRNNNIEHNDNLFEHNIAAASGSWWQIELCTDGTPRGYRVFNIDGEKVSWYYKSSGKNKGYQFRVINDANGDFIVNVWNYDPKWKVEWYENKIYKGEINPYTGYDPKVEQLTKDKSSFKYKWISPSKTAHLFRIKPSSAASNVRLKVTDRFGNVYEESLR